VMTEQLSDEVSARRLELRVTQMALSILEGEISRAAASLKETRKELRLAEDTVEAGVRSQQHQWLLQMARLKNDADEASVEAAETGRLVNWEALEGQRARVEFLERKLAAARAQAWLTKADVDGVIHQIKDKRAAVQRELNEAINNFISGVILICERSIRVGDIVEVDDQRGKVVRLGFRNSLVARGDGIEVLVPNSQFLEKKVVNWTLSNDLVRYAVSVGVAYGAPLTKVTELIGQAAAEHLHVIKDPAPEVLLEDFGDNALVFSLQFWMRLSPTVNGGKVRSELRLRINELFQRSGISIAFPQRDIHLDTTRPLE